MWGRCPGDQAVTHQTFTCQAYSDDEGMIPVGQPMLVTAPDRTVAVLKATEMACEAGTDWAMVAILPPMPSSGRSQRRRLTR